MDDNTITEAAPLPFWKRKPTMLAAGAVSLALVLAVGGYLMCSARTPTPSSTISAIASDAMRGNAEGVAAAIDTTSIVDSAVDDILSGSGGRSALVSDYLKKHPDATSAQVKSKARATMNEEIREHVEAGTLPKRIPLGSPTIKALVAKAVAGRAVKSVKIDGNVAHAVVTVPYKSRRLTVQVRLRRAGGTWKVDRIENLAAVMKQAGY